MKNKRFTSLAAAACALAAVISAPLADAQTYKVEGKKPDFDDFPSPDFSGGKQKSFKAKDWLEIEASLKIQMSPEPPSKTVDRILVKWYVAVENPDKKGTYLLLTKDITHVNVPLNEEVFSSVYLSPASVRRLSGSDRAGKSLVYLVGYEVLVNGEKVAQETSKEKVGWWNSASDKISRTESVPLLDKSESAFAHMWWDRYAEILKERR
ncbi:hypothetical protein HZ994_05575 [Akkermansiaceae bacterium]|nr:hypothetical protein HZ994_05575 [Akkermansiaceae bacterium]